MRKGSFKLRGTDYKGVIKIFRGKTTQGSLRFSRMGFNVVSNVFPNQEPCRRP